MNKSSKSFEVLGLKQPAQRAFSTEEWRHSNAYYGRGNMRCFSVPPCLKVISSRSRSCGTFGSKQTDIWPTTCLTSLLWKRKKFGSLIFQYQIDKEGNPINVHNKKKVITLGVTSTIPTLRIPNTLLLASSIVSSEEHISKSTSIFHQPLPGKLELKRLFPLCLVNISIHNLEKKQLRLKLVTGRTYYLQLYPASHQQQDLFVCWIKLVQILRPSSKINFNQQKLENKKLEKHGAPLVPTPKPKKMHLCFEAHNFLVLLESVNYFRNVSDWNKDLKASQICISIQVNCSLSFSLPSRTVTKFQSLPPQRESQCAPEKKTKNKKSICPVIQNPTTQAKETKKENDPTTVRSKSSLTPEIKQPPLKIENVHEAFYQTTPENKNIAKKLEREKIENPGAGDETENLDINRYRKPVRKNLSSQSRSGHRGAARKPSKIASLFIGCFRSQRKKKRSNKGKRYRAE
ncbi:uncharacterized protein LOC117664622 isoform X2 [Pantherophis guttatus]|uniref:Uncharacterized protein LOC117664622 isoform X2 n=1 Tax=Pantherophis guttatus TaxID=94885 RepID=A0A6P9BK41_PANGU|nr:uncharacterized protein LOC117664622 isoform X2 [Pantherophis guttatus]